MATNDGQGTGRSGDKRRQTPSTAAGSKGPDAASKRDGETVPGGGGATELPEQFGRYHIKKKLGGGGMGAVYLAYDSELDRDVAIKVPHFSDRDDPDVRERFLREARSAAKLDHPNLCPVFDVGVLDGVYYLTMRHLKGVLLSAYAGLPQPPRKVVEVVAKLAQALESAHRKDVIHRDLKPDNVMMCGSVGPTVMDFGLAKQSRQQDRKLTQTGTAMGTPSYMPPEQVRGELDRMGPASDVYSLGVILFELLTGRLPFDGGIAEVYGKILYTEPPPPSQLQVGLNPVLDSICARALAKAPEQRYASMKAFAAVLTDYLKTTPATQGAGQLIAKTAAGGAVNREQILAAPTVAPGASAPRHRDDILAAQTVAPSQPPAGTPPPFPKGQSDPVQPLPVDGGARPPSSVRQPAASTEMVSPRERANAAEAGGVSPDAVVGGSASVQGKLRVLPIVLGLVGAPVLLLLTGLCLWGLLAMAGWMSDEMTRHRAAQEAEQRALQQASERASQEAAQLAERQARERASREAAERQAREAAESNATKQSVASLPDRDEGVTEDVPSPWANAARQAVQQGVVRVRVSGLRIEARRLHVLLLIENTGSADGRVYHGWGVARGKIAPRLLDDRDIAWPGLPSSPDARLPGQASAHESLFPGRPITDVLVFAASDAPTAFLRLELPGAGFGGGGQFRLQIPRSMLLLQAPLVRGAPAVGELCPILKDKSEKRRVAAASALGEFGQAAGGAVPDLLDALQDMSWEVRAAAGKALGKIGREAGGAWPALLPLLADSREEVRAATRAALELVAPPSKTDFTGLGRLLTHRNATVRARSAAALRNVGPEARKAFVTLLKVLQDADKDVRKAAAVTLESLGPPEAAYVPTLGDALKGGTPEARAYSLYALAQLGPEARAATSDLAAAVRDKDGEFRKRAGEVLKKVDASASVRAFAAALRDADEDIRLDAIEALAATGSRAMEAVPSLVATLEDKVPLIRVKAARALWKIEPPGNPRDRVFRTALKDKEKRVRQEAADGIADMGPAARDSALALGEALKDADRGVRQRAASGLNKIGAREKTLVPNLILAMEEEVLRKDSIAVLARIGEDAVPALIRALESNKQSVRLGAVTTLGRIGPGAKDAYKTLVFMYRNDPAPEVRQATTVALGQIRKK